MTRRLAVGVLLVGALVAAPKGYVLSGYRWAVPEIPYYVNPANQDVPPQVALAAVKWAADAWSTQTDASVRLVYAGLTSASEPSRNGKNEVIFRPVESAVGNVGGTWRYQRDGVLYETDVVFYDGGYTFYSTALGGCIPELKGHYIEAIGIHEFGHLFGLQHSTVSGATMKAGATRCSTAKLSLHSDDIAGIEAIYPPEAPDPTPAASGISVTTKPPKVTVAVNWSGAAGSSVSIYVDGGLYGTTANDGAQSVTLSGPGPWSVQVCETSGACSPVVTVTLQ